MGDDPMKAGEFGIKNLKYILSNLGEWVTDDTDFTHREELYKQLANQYYRYIMNVMYNVGGIYLTEVKDGHERTTPRTGFESDTKGFFGLDSERV